MDSRLTEEQSAMNSFTKCEAEASSKSNMPGNNPQNDFKDQWKGEQQAVIKRRVRNAEADFRRLEESMKVSVARQEPRLLEV